MRAKRPVQGGTFCMEERMKENDNFADSQNEDKITQYFENDMALSRVIPTVNGIFAVGLFLYIVTMIFLILSAPDHEKLPLVIILFVGCIPFILLRCIFSVLFIISKDVKSIRNELSTKTYETNNAEKNASDNN